MTGFNLILFQGKNGVPHISDYLTVRHMMRGPAPEITVYVVADNAALPGDFWSRIAQQPTLIFAPMVVDIPPTARGARMVAHNSSKAEQAEWFASTGLPHPTTKLIEIDTELDEKSWGPFTVVKPNRLGQGRGIRLVRTSDVKWRAPDSWPKGDDRHGRQLIAQQFINTGQHSRSHRVFSVLGQPIYSIVSEASEKLELPDPSGKDAVDLDIAVQSGHRVIKMSHDDDVISLAKSVHQKFPHLPTLGIDIIREEETGRLFLLEMHPAGGTWHLSTPHGLKHQRDHGLDYYGQFNALDTIAKALIDTTRTMAK